MKKITKGKEPISLTKYRSSIPIVDMEKPNIYDDYREKDILRTQLLEEQGYLCCYCMSQITERNSKIEHFKAQSLFRDKQIKYSNLFVACKGGEGTKEHSCDTLKGNKSLNTINLTLKIESDLKYSKQGEISSVISTETKVSSLTKEINDVLNLNSIILTKNRKQTYEDFKNKYKGKLSKRELKRAIKFYQTKENGRYPPYSEMMVFLLNKKLKGY